MTDIEILKKAIEEALHNNWEQMLPFVPTWALEQANEDRLTQHIIKTYGKSIIFSHDFAKAFWGGEVILEKPDYITAPKGSYCRNCDAGEEDIMIATPAIAWQYHLQQMVLEENPLKYVEKFI